MLSNSFFFATKVWLTSVILSPLVFFTFYFHNDLNLSVLAFYTPSAIVSGLLFSLPCWIISIFVIWFINTRVQSLPKKKMLIILTGIVLTNGLFYLLFKLFNDELFSLYLATPYNLTIILGVIFYKLRSDLTS